MAVDRTPPTNALDSGETVASFDLWYREWKKMLQRANSFRLKVLQALVQDGSTRASELLGERPRYENAVRCNQCAGCLVMSRKQACHKCSGCVARSGCVEYNRLCFSWDRVVQN